MKKGSILHLQFKWVSTMTWIFRPWLILIAVPNTVPITMTLLGAFEDPTRMCLSGNFLMFCIHISGMMIVLTPILRISSLPTMTWSFITLVILTADSYKVPSIMPLLGAFEDSLRMCLSGSFLTLSVDRYSMKKASIVHLQFLCVSTMTWIFRPWLILIAGSNTVPTTMTLLGAFEDPIRMCLSGSLLMFSTHIYHMMKVLILALHLTTMTRSFVTLVILTADSYAVPSILPLLGAFEDPLRMCLSRSFLTFSVDRYGMKEGSILYLQFFCVSTMTWIYRPWLSLTADSTKYQRPWHSLVHLKIQFECA